MRFLLPAAAACLAACGSPGNEAATVSSQPETPVLQTIATPDPCSVGPMPADTPAAYKGRNHYVCQLPPPEITSDAALAQLGDERLTLQADGDVLTMLMRSENGAEPIECCSLQGVEWSQIDESAVWVTRLRLLDLQSGMLKQASVSLGPDTIITEDDWVEWRGPGAPDMPEFDPELEGQVIETELYSPELEETRRIEVYLPPGADLGTPLPVIFMADGGVDWHARYIEPLIRSGKIRPVLLIGLPSGQNGIVEDRSELGNDIRNLDYLIPDAIPEAFGISRFDAHLKFVTDTLLSHIRETYPASPEWRNTVVTGGSSGGGFALNAALRAPATFGHSWPMSPGSGDLRAPIENWDGPKPAFRLSAGYYEPSFLKSAMRTEENLRASGFDVDTHWFAAGHSTDQREIRFVENLKAVFPAED